MNSWSHIVVTGAAGFLGRAVVRALVAAGYRVTALDDLSRGNPAAGDDATHFVRLDVRDRSSVEALLRKQRPDAVVHLANWTRPDDERDAPEILAEVGVGGTAALLGAMRATDTPHIVYASDIAVYGDGSEDFDEDAEFAPLGVRARLVAETERLLDACAASWGLRPLALRLPVLGGADRAAGIAEWAPPFSRLVPRAVRAARRRKHGLQVHERDGSPRVLDLLHVMDAADGVLAAIRVAQRGDSHSYGPVRALNVTSGVGVTEREVAEILGEVSGRPVDTAVAPLPAHLPLRCVASSARLRELGGWTPRRSLRDVLSSAWEADERSREAETEGPGASQPED